MGNGFHPYMCVGEMDSIMIVYGLCPNSLNGPGAYVFSLSVGSYVNTAIYAVCACVF